MGSVSTAVCLTNTTLRRFNDSYNIILVHNARWCWMAFDYWELFLLYNSDLWPASMCIYVNEVYARARVRVCVMLTLMLAQAPRVGGQGQ